MVIDFILSLFKGIDKVFIDVLIALTPVAGLFIVAQIFFLHYKKKRLINIFKGLIITIVGLVLFLQGAQNGYLSIAQDMGAILGSLEPVWVILPLGFLLGLSTTLADPSIYVLAQETEKASGGAIRKKLLFITLCFGVGLAIVLALLKLILDLNILWIIIPGYTIAIILSYIVEPDFSSLAFDSGGVVTGTMIASFILPLVTGIAKSLGRDPLIDGFGIVGLVALTPILTMLILGVLLKRQAKH